MMTPNFTHKTIYGLSHTMDLDYLHSRFGEFDFCFWVIGFGGIPNELTLVKNDPLH